MQESGVRSNPARRGTAGFSLIETMVAIAVLTIGVLSVVRMIPLATRTDFGTRTDSTAVFVAKRQLEQMLSQPWNMPPTNCGSIPFPCFTDAADGTGATATVGMACTCASPPCTGNAGALLNASGDIDFSQAQGAAALIGYRRSYVIPATTGNIVKLNQGSYEIRWHITCNLYGTSGVGNGAGLMSIVVAARPTGNLPGMIPVQANLRAVKMK